MPASLAITRPSHSIVRTRSNFWGLYQSRAQIALRTGRFSDMFQIVWGRGVRLVGVAGAGACLLIVGVSLNRPSPARPASLVEPSPTPAA